MPVFLHGLSLQFYRGIGPERQRMGPFKDFNFFIGPNNAGKSTVLNFINDHLPNQKSGLVRNKKFFTEDNLCVYRGRDEGTTAVEIGINRDTVSSCKDGEIYERIKSDVDDTWYKVLSESETEIQKNQAIETRVRKGKEPLESLAEFLHESGLIWFSYDNFADLWDLSKSKSIELMEFRNSVWKRLFVELFAGNHRYETNKFVPDAIRKMSKKLNVGYPSVSSIPAYRRIGSSGTDMVDQSGEGLIDRLAQIQSPGHENYDKEKETFNKINQFLQLVTDKADARIEIPYSKAHVLVHMDNKVLPLESLGTGIHEVIMIAAFCTISENQIVCIEEPEIHLHPVLQRKLIRYLKDNTSNQYFIATHSAAFIDTPDAAIFRVTNDGVQTRVESATLDGDKLSICRDLGYKASDILQANAVIWVEGPSDRIYINHWIKAVNADLIEGIHYSIMFYGGRLLSHLDADWEVLDELINLRKINQNLAVVIDSDKAKKGERLNDTKKRIQKELEGDGSIAWVTMGREIENYVEHSVLQEAVKAVHPNLYGKPSSGGQYDHALHFIKAETRAAIHKGADKVRVAREVCKKEANFEVLDLKAQIKALVKMIEKANE